MCLDLARLGSAPFDSTHNSIQLNSIELNLELNWTGLNTSFAFIASFGMSFSFTPFPPKMASINILLKRKDICTANFWRSHQHFVSSFLFLLHKQSPFSIHIGWIRSILSSYTIVHSSNTATTTTSSSSSDT